MIGNMGLFAPVDDPGMTLQFDVDDFWQLT
jgi:hypothetical protein